MGGKAGASLSSIPKPERIRRAVFTRITLADPNAATLLVAPAAPLLLPRA